LILQINKLGAAVRLAVVGPHNVCRSAGRALVMLWMSTAPALATHFSAQHSKDGAAPAPSKMLRVAQLPPEFRILVQDRVLGEPGSEVALVARVSGVITEKTSFVRVRGLPDWVKLTHGHRVGVGSWAVSPADLGVLRIAIPVGAVSSKSDVEIALVAIDGPVLSETKTVLIVAPPGAPPVKEETARKQPVQSTLVAAGAAALGVPDANLRVESTNRRTPTAEARQQEAAQQVERPAASARSVASLDPRPPASSPALASTPVADGTYLTHARPACGEPFQSVLVKIAGGKIVFEHVFRNIVYGWSGSFDDTGKIAVGVGPLSGSGNFGEQRIELNYPQCAPSAIVLQVRWRTN
jgi:hypothetical protein